MEGEIIGKTVVIRGSQEDIRRIMEDMARQSKEAGGVKRPKYDDQRDPRVLAYLEELIAVGRKHGFTLAHEDYHGGFIVRGSDEENEAWLAAAAQDLPEEGE